MLFLGGIFCSTVGMISQGARFQPAQSSAHFPTPPPRPQWKLQRKVSPNEVPQFQGLKRRWGSLRVCDSGQFHSVELNSNSSPILNSIAPAPPENKFNVFDNRHLSYLSPMHSKRLNIIGQPVKNVDNGLHNYPFVHC